MNDQSFEYRHDPNSRVIHHFETKEQSKTFVDELFSQTLDNWPIKYDSDKELSEKAWDIYNTCTALNDLAEVYPETRRDIDACFCAILTTLNGNLRKIVSELPRFI